MAGTPESDTSLAGFRLSARDELGVIEEDRLDLVAAADIYTGLVTAYDEVLAAPSGKQAAEEAKAAKIATTEKQIRTMMFVDSSKAVDLADKALATAVQERQPRETMADLHHLHGLALMNAGQFAAARSSLLAGFMIDRKSPAIESDLALLSRIAPDTGKPAKLLDYRLDLPAEDYPTPSPGPRCGEAGLKTSDFGVVQLQIANDGTSFNVKPIYSSAGTAGAILFAQSVAGWKWPAQQPKPTVPQFYRLGTRVEVHCRP